MTARRLTVALLASALGGCTGSGPYDAEERRALSGALFYVVGGGHEHGTTVKRRPAAGGPAAAVTDGRAPAFSYGASPRDGRVALTIADDLYLAAPDGSGLERLASSDAIDWYPRFSPDGRHLVFESARASFRDLYRLDLESGEVRRLTDDPEGNFDAAWSPTGRRLAFASSRAGQLDVWVMDADGGSPRRLTTHAGDSVKPGWSPSGRWIAFISARDGQDDLFVIRPDGADLTKLTPDARRAPHVTRFAWHPTEDRIAYVARPLGGRGAIYVVDAEGGAQKRLSGPEHDDREPSWSPDGAHLAFASVEGGDSEIYIMRADGTRRTKVTDEADRAWLPRWLGAKGDDRE